MSNEKPFSEFIDNTISKRQIVLYTKELLFATRYCFRFLFDLPKNSR